MCGVSPTGPRRRLFWALALCVVLAIAAFTWHQLDRIDAGVTRRRAVATAERLRQEQESTRQRGVLIRICEDGINGNRADLLQIIADLSDEAPPAADEVEAEQRARSQRIFDQGLAVIDCGIYVDTGAKVPATTVP